MRKFAFILVAVVLLASPLSVFAKTHSTTQVTYTSGFQVQNLSTTATATIEMDFYNQSGTMVANPGDTVAPSTNNTYYPLSAVSAGFNGSVVISSNEPVAAIANVLGNGGQRSDSYGGFSSGGSPVNLPIIFKSYFNNNTWFNVQNTSLTTAATVNVTYVGSPAPSGGCPSGNVTIQPGAAATFDQSTNACLPSSFVGAATVTSNEPIAAVAMEVGSLNLLAYSGFSSAGASTDPVMPLVMQANYGNSTSVNIMNTGSAQTTVTVSYTPSSGSPGTACTETHAIGAGAMVPFGYPMPAACGTKFVGSAEVTTNTPVSGSAPGLVAVVNQVSTLNANSSAYDAFNPALATANVSMPLVMDRNYGLYTGISVVNMGTQPENITCTFQNTTYTLSGTSVPAGAMIGDVQNNKIANGYVGSGTCTATGGSAKLAAIVNQVKSAVAGDDVLTTYSGINY
jgi:hypothetical protein